MQTLEFWESRVHRFGTKPESMLSLTSARGLLMMTQDHFPLPFWPHRPKTSWSHVTIKSRVRALLHISGRDQQWD